MRLGLSSYLFRWALGTPQFRPARALSLFDLVEIAADLDGDVLQLADQSVLDRHCTGEGLRDLHIAAATRGLALEVGTTGCEASRLEHYLDVALALHSQLVRLVLDTEAAPRSRSEVVTTLRSCAPAYRRAGVALAIENHFRISSRELIEIVEAVGDPAVGVCLDTANSIGAYEWPWETIRLLAPYAINVHVKDYTATPHPDGVGVIISGVPLGKGRLDISALLEAVASTGLRPTIVLEHWLPRQVTETATLELERAWVREGMEVARAHLAALAMPGKQPVQEGADAEAAQ